MPDISRRSLAAGVGLLAGAVASARQRPASLPPPRRPSSGSSRSSSTPTRSSGLSAQSITESSRRATTRAAVNRLNAIERATRQARLRQGPSRHEVGELKREEQSGLQFLDSARALFRVPRRRADPARRACSPQAIGAGFRQPRSLEGGVRRHGQGGWTDGTGWVILTYTPRDKRLIQSPGAPIDGTGPAGCVPLIVIDMDKHAYTARLRRRGPANMSTASCRRSAGSTPERLYREAIRV